MRFSIATALLAATAIAAPLQDVDKRAARVEQNGGLTVRSILSLLPRVPAVVPLKPVTPKPVPHDTTVNPGDAEPVPLQPSKGDPIVNPNEPDTQPPSLRPDTDAPAAKPDPVAACSLKRGCKGANEALGIDEKYKRVVETTTGPEGQYLKDAGFVDGKTKWVKLTTKNKDDVADSLEEIWVKDLVENQGYNQREAQNLVDELKDDLLEGPHADFVVTSHNMKKGDGVMVAESSYNAQYDLHRAYKGEYNGKKYTRPAIKPEEEVKWAVQAMDNLRVAAKAQGTSVKDLRHIGRHNIETEDVQDILRDLMGGQPGKKTFTVAGHPNEVAKIEPTLHAKTTNALLRDNAAELGNLKITQYTVTYDGTRFDMMIDVAP